jgi:hypothetical protein
MSTTNRAPRSERAVRRKSTGSPGDETTCGCEHLVEPAGADPRRLTARCRGAVPCAQRLPRHRGCVDVVGRTAFRWPALIVVFGRVAAFAERAL